MSDDLPEIDRFILYETGDGYCVSCQATYHQYDDMVAKLREQAARIEELEAASARRAAEDATDDR